MSRSTCTYLYRSGHTRSLSNIAWGGSKCDTSAGGRGLRSSDALNPTTQTGLVMLAVTSGLPAFQSALRHYTVNVNSHAELHLERRKVRKNIRSLHATSHDGDSTISPLTAEPQAAGPSGVDQEFIMPKPSKQWSARPAPQIISHPNLRPTRRKLLRRGSIGPLQATSHDHLESLQRMPPFSTAKPQFAASQQYEQIGANFTASLANDTSVFPDSLQPPPSDNLDGLVEWSNRRDFAYHVRDGGCAMIILNTDCVGPLLRRFWSLADVRICADGGANRLYDGLSPHERGLFLPQYITGDLDSLRPDVAAYYAKMGTYVIQDHNQENSDLDKCIALIVQGAGGRLTQGGLNTNVVVFGALGLRFDHSMANLHALYRYEQTLRRFILCGSESLAFLLPAGRNLIRPDEALEGPVCGLIPLARPCRSITTNGLRWDLKQQRMEFGSLVSTSNEFKHHQREDVKVIVENSDPIIWTTAITAKYRMQTIKTDDRQQTWLKVPRPGHSRITADADEMAAAEHEAENWRKELDEQ